MLLIQGPARREQESGNPIIEYAAATTIAQRALETGESVYDLVLEQELMGQGQLDELLQPAHLTRPRMT